MSHPIPPPPDYETPSSSRPSTPSWSAPAVSNNSPTISTISMRASTFPSKAKHQIAHRLHHSLHHDQNSAHDQPHNHHHRHHRRYHERDKSGPHSAATLPTSLHAFGESLTGLTRIGNSNNKGADEGKWDGGRREGEEEMEMEKMKSRKKKQGRRKQDLCKEVERKREEVRRAQLALHQKLQSLTALSTTITRRLDYTYYSLLTHLSTLSSLTSQLSDLSTNTKKFLTTFKTKSSSLITTYSNQIDTFNTTLDSKIARISEFEHRLNRGRNTVAELNRRLNDVREKVQREEKREKEGEERLKKRLRIFWAVLGIGTGLFLVLGLLRCWPWPAKLEVKPHRHPAMKLHDPLPIPHSQLRRFIIDDDGDDDGGGGWSPANVNEGRGARGLDTGAGMKAGVGLRRIEEGVKRTKAGEQVEEEVINRVLKLFDEL